MCGIAGLVKKDGGRVLSSELKKLTDLVMHRGPDDEGVYINGNVGLGHRRLSIIYLSASGHQPMVYGNLKIVFNGEIYNYLELREELKAVNFSFCTGTDTEVIAASYLHWGQDCVRHFNGMWAIVIFDEDKNILFCSRDRFGVKPFYFVNTDSIFAFGSEIKQLHSLGFNKVNVQILLDFLFIGYQNHSSETFFKHVHQLEPGRNLVYDVSNNKMVINRYYQLELNEEIRTLKLDDAAKLYEEKILDAIRLRLRSDVRVGTCLSGGLDSSYIASVASEYYHTSSGERFTSITAQSGDSKNDETAYAKMVIDKAGLNGKFVFPSFENMQEDIDKVVYHQEEPFADPSIVMQYFVMKFAKENECTVLLDGQGGDETLLGYERYYISFLKSIPTSSFGKWFKKIRANSKLSLAEVISYYFYFGFPFLRIIRLRNRMKGLKKEYKKCLKNELVYEYAKASGNIFQLQSLEITKTQLRSLLNYEDKNSMTWSIETRLPFLDYLALETAVSINPSHKIKDGWSKYILRKIGSSVLPEKIAWRKNKIGFEPPKWFWKLTTENEKLITHSKILNTLFKDVSKVEDPVTKWKFLSIAMWEKKFGMQLDD